MITIFQAWKGMPTSQDDLTVESRFILGILTACKIKSEAEISKILGLLESDVADFLFRCRASSHPVLKRVLAEGLDLSASVSIRSRVFWDTLYCRECHNAIGYLPCVMCANRKRVLRGQLDDEYGETIEEDAPESKFPTPHTPGTWDKVSVMRYRVSCGLQPTSPRDFSWL